MVARGDGPAGKRLGRAGRAIRAVALTVLVGGTFASAVIVGLIAHLDMPATRRVIQASVNQILAGLFDGQVRLGAIEELDLEGLRVAHFEAVAPTGEKVIDIEGVRVRGGWLGSVLGLALDGGGGTLELDHVRVERGFVGLAIEDGKPLPLAEAFGTGPSAADEGPSDRAPFALEVDTVELGEVRVTGSLAPSVPLDATVSRLHAQLRVGEEGIALDVARSSLSETALVGAPIRGSVDYHLQGRFEEEGDLAMGGTFAGHLGQIQLLVEAVVRDGEVVAAVDLPRVGAEDLAPWAEDFPLTRPVSARLGLAGRPSHLKLSGRVDMPSIEGAEAGQIELSGVLAAADTVTVDARVDVARFDARLLASDLPPTSLSLGADVSLAFDGSDPRLRVAIDGRPSRVDDHVLPPIAGVVEVGGAKVTGRLVVGEEGAATDLYLHYAKPAGIVFALSSRVPSLSAAPRISALTGGQPVGGRAIISAEGRYLPGGEADVHAQADVSGLVVPSADVRVGSGRAIARLTGNPTDPQRMRLEASATGRGARFGGRDVERFRASAVGPVSQPTLEAEVVDRDQRKLTARAVADPARKQLRSVDVTVDAGSTRLTGRIDRLASLGPALALDGIDLSGMGGQARGNLRVEGGELVGELEGTDFDLGDLSRMLGLRLPLRGSANLSVALERTPGGRRGHVQVRMENAGVLLLGGLELSLDTRFDGDLVESEAALAMMNPLDHEEGHPCAATVATILVEDVEARLEGPLLSAQTWQRANIAGTVGLEAAQLACLAEIWQQASPLEPIPVTEVAGVLDASIGLAHAAGAAYPSLTHFGLKTTGLVLAGRPTEPDTEPPWKTDALDLAVVGALDGPSGRAQLSVALIDDDRRTASNLARPPLLRFDAIADLDLDTLLEGGEATRVSLETTRLSAALETTRSPFRRWAAIPAPFRSKVEPIGGEVEVDVYLEGTLRDPSIAARGRIWGLSPPRPDDEPWPVRNDLDVIATYLGGEGRIDGTLHRDGDLAIELSGESTGNLSTRLLGGGHDPRWTGWLRAELEGLELQSLPSLTKLGIAGAVTGHVEVQGLGDDPLANVSLRIPRLQMGSRLHFEKVALALQPVGDAAGTMRLQVEMPLVRQGQQEGLLRITGYGGLDWEDRLYPQPALDRAAGLYVVADRFPLAAARPFVDDTVAGLSGRLGGELRVGYKESATREVSVDMDMWLRQGAGQLRSLGQDFHGIQAHLTARGGLLEVDELEVRSGTGRAHGSLRAGLAGLGINVMTGTLRIDDAEPFPVASEGVPLGQVTGRIDANVSLRDRRIEALLVTRDLRLRLPPSANRDVQQLETHPDVEIVQPLAAPNKARGEAGEEPAMPIELTVVLSPTQILGNQLRIELLTEKPLTVRSGGTVRGEIVVTGGELIVLDKTFRIERGTVLLREEEPGNPYLNVTAHWDAPEGTTVYVDYVGPLKPMSRESFRFRSNPPRPESEVLALLIFGDANAGAAGADQGSGVANSVAAAQFNAVLGQLAPGLSTKVSTSSATLTYQLTDSVTVSAMIENQQGQGAVSEEGATDTSSSGAAPSDASQRSELSVDWRFAKRWLLRGTVGVGVGATSGIDLLFQHRY